MTRDDRGDRRTGRVESGTPLLEVPASARTGSTRGCGPLSIGLLIFGPDGTVRDCNTAACEMLGLSKGDLLGLGPGDHRWRMLDEAGEPCSVDCHPISIACRTGVEVLGTTMGFKLPDGTYTWLSVSAACTAGDSRSFGGVSTLVDVHGPRGSASERESLEGQPGTMVDAGPRGIITCRADTFEVLSVNEAGLRHSGVDRADQMIGSRLLDWLSLDQRCSVRADLDRLRRGTAPSVEDEWVFRRPDGAARQLRVQCSLVASDASGAPHALLVQAEDVTDVRTIDRPLADGATRDALTGLANRAQVTRLLEEARSAAPSRTPFVSLLFIGLDDLERVNSRFGHEGGDRVLRVVANRWVAAWPHLRAARFGGDEFVVVLAHDVDSQETATVEAESVAEALLAIVGEPVELDDVPQRLSASAGIAVGRGDTQERDLLRRADLALRKAKADGRRRHRVFSADLERRSDNRIRVELDLGRAIEGSELLIYLQPIVDLREGGLVGAEALLRWQHPTRGLLAPVQFLDVAEESGLIVPIDSWGLGEACRLLRAVRDLGVDLPAVAVNVSGTQLVRSDVAALAEAAMDQHGMHRSDLIIELTERSVIEAGAVSLVNELAEMGMRVGLDDFGTGHSSLSNLKDLSISFLKVDRTFIEDIQTNPISRAIVSGIGSLGADLSMDVVAEGVEDPATAQAAMRAGCNRAQGWLYGRPMPLESFVEKFSTR